MSEIPDLTCPGIDAAISALEAVRRDNSQMRYGYWHLEEEVKSLRAEIERLTKERDNLSKLEQSHREQANEQFHRANKAEAERDEALALLADAYGAGTGGSVIEDHLAEAERDMRQRAAETAREAWRDGYDATPHILALPLKHADRDGRAALAQGQKEGE